MNFSEKLSRWIVSYPKKSLTLVGLLLLLTMPGLLFIQLDYSVEAWFGKNDTMLSNYKYFKNTFGTDDAVQVVMIPENNLFTQENLEDIRDITNEFWNVPAAIRVDSISNFSHISNDNEGEILIQELLHQEFVYTKDSISKLKQIIMSHEQIPGRLISYDGSSALIFIRLKNHFDEKQDFASVMSAVNQIIDKYKAKGHKFKVVGTVKVTETFREVAEKDLFVMIPILNVLIFLVLLFLFRSKGGVILPFTVISVTISSAMGISGFLGAKLNNLSGMVPTILIAICIADSIHILSTYVKLKNEEDAFFKTLKKNMIPTFLTTISTTLGFLSLSFNDLIPIQDFGVLCGLGCLFAWFYSIFGIIPSIMLFKDFLDVKELKTSSFNISGKLYKVIKKRAWPIIIIFIFLTLGGFRLAINNEVNSNPFEYFSDDVDLVQSNDYIKDKYKGFNGLELILDSGEDSGIHSPAFLKKLEKLETWILSKDKVHKTISVLENYKAMNRAMNEGEQKSYKVPETRNEAAQLYLLYSLDLPQGMDLTHQVDQKDRVLRVTILWSIQDSKTSIIESKKIENYANSIGLNTFATGQEYLFQGMNKYVVQGYFKSIAISLIIITIMMMIVLKSFTYGLISIFPNLIPIIFGGIAMSLLNRPIDVGTVLVASVCFGIAIDDTIHFLAEFRKHKSVGKDTDTSIRLTLENTGVALITTTLILTLGFSVFAFASFVPNFNFGVFSAFVLIVALVTDLLFLPAILKVLDRT